MLVPLHYPSNEPATALLPVNLAAVDAAHLVHILVAQPPASFLIDCGALPCQHTHGICYLISQLLVLRQSGASIWLRNASPVLRRCLQQLQLSAVFLLAE